MNFTGKKKMDSRTDYWGLCTGAYTGCVKGLAAAVLDERCSQANASSLLTFLMCVYAFVVVQVLRCKGFRRIGFRMQP